MQRARRSRKRTSNRKYLLPARYYGPAPTRYGKQPLLFKLSRLRAALDRSRPSVGSKFIEAAEPRSKFFSSITRPMKAVRILMRTSRFRLATSYSFQNGVFWNSHIEASRG